MAREELRAAGAVGAVFLSVSLLWAVAVDRGKDLYAAKCASCHGKDAKGNPGMAKLFKLDLAVIDLTDKDTLAKKDEDLTAVVLKGRDKMPKFEGKLKDAEVADVVAYVKGLGSAGSAPAAVPTSAAASPASASPDGAKIYAAKCAMCHGKDPAKAASVALNLTDKDTLSKADKDLI